MNLKEIRKKENITQEEIAKRLSITQSTYSAYESGRVEPNIETIIKLSKIFNITTDELLGIEKKGNDVFPEQSELLKTINKLTEIECHKLNVFAQGLIMNRNFEQKERTLKIIKNIEEEK